MGWPEAQRSTIPPSNTTPRVVESHNRYLRTCVLISSAGHAVSALVCETSRAAFPCFGPWQQCSRVEPASLHRQSPQPTDVTLHVSEACREAEPWTRPTQSARHRTLQDFDIFGSAARQRVLLWCDKGLVSTFEKKKERSSMNKRNIERITHIHPYDIYIYIPSIIHGRFDEANAAAGLYYVYGYKTTSVPYLVILAFSKHHPRQSPDVWDVSQQHPNSPKAYQQ